MSDSDKKEPSPEGGAEPVPQPPVGDTQPPKQPADDNQPPKQPTDGEQQPDEPSRAASAMAATSPSAKGCFRVDVRENSIRFDYYPKEPDSQISTEHLELIGQISRTEAVLKSIIYPDGLPPGLDLTVAEQVTPDGQVSAQGVKSQAVQDVSRSEPAAKEPQAASVEQVPEGTKASETPPAPKRSMKERWVKLVGIAEPPGKDKRKENTFISYFRGLYLLAKLGLDGPLAQPWMARLSLVTFKDEILTLEGGRSKNRYMLKLGKYALIYGLPALAIIVLEEIMHVVANLNNATDGLVLRFLYDPINEIFRVLLFAWVGAMAGAWVSYAIKNPVLTFQQLAIPDEDRLKPGFRLIYVGLLAEILVSALILRVIDIKIGAFDTANLLKQTGYAFIIGAFCGLAQNVIAQKLEKSAETIAK